MVYAGISAYTTVQGVSRSISLIVLIVDLATTRPVIMIGALRLGVHMILSAQIYVPGPAGLIPVAVWITDHGSAVRQPLDGEQKHPAHPA
jgi:hypothetical protein